MRRVGTVVRTAQGLAIVRSDDDTHPALGTTVVDEQLENVGQVVDVMGPTIRPYVVVKPSGSPAALLESRLYVRT